MLISFDQLLHLAAQQTEPQRILFVFATRELRPGHQEKKEPDFTIIPQMFNDKTLDQLSTFDALAQEAKDAGLIWDLLFASGLEGANGQVPSLKLTDERLDLMVQAILQGVVEPFAIFDPSGNPVNLSRS